ncbi:MAG: hypothetical protein OHK0017_09100 [Patescibacteria group bacterium]
MKNETAKKLIALNQKFYDEIGQYWNNSSDYVWEGWDLLFLNQVLPQMHRELSKAENQTYSILDLGCGNGRFGDYAWQQFQHLAKSKSLESGMMSFVGIDFSDFYKQLFTAKFNKKSKKGLIADFIQSDLILTDWTQEPKIQTNKFDLVTLFGLMHHVPGYQNKVNLIRRSASVLKLGGIICFTTWQFLLEKRLVKRIVSKFSEEYSSILNQLEISDDELDKSDYILDWIKKEKGYRFSHFISNQEAEQIISEAGLKILMEYPADGRFSQTNRYYICQLESL